MSKTVILGDTHGRSFWKLIVNTEEFDKVVFIGDYFDSFDITAEDQMNNFLDIIEYKKNGGKEVILLIGNHDYHYFPEIGYSGISGYQVGAAKSIEHLIDTYRDHLQMAHSQDDVLFTHAGVGETWLDNNHKTQDEGYDMYTPHDIELILKDLWGYTPRVFGFTGRDPYGDDMGQTPIWIRPRSLMRDSQELKKQLIQVVGHTSQKKIDIEGKSTGGRYYFIDTLGTSGEYLILEDNMFKTGKI